MQLRHYIEAKADLEVATRLNPQDNMLQEELRYVEEMLLKD